MGQTPSPAEARLNQAMASQDPKQIAQAQMQLSTRLKGTQRIEMQMRSLETAIDASDFTLANNLLAQADTRPQWSDYAPRRAQLLAGFAQWQAGQTDQALNSVSNLPLPLTAEEGIRRLSLMAAIEEAAHRPIDAARQRTALGGMLSGAEADTNQAALWNDLNSAPPQAIADAIKSESNPVFIDWLGLNLVYRTRPGELQSWIQNHPNHPAVTSGFANMLTGQASATAIPMPTGNGPIIVLLPLSGDYQTISKAISDGINFAHDRLGLAGDRSVQIMDSGETLASFSQALNTALAAQPSVIIGPLLKEQIPALNNIPGNAPPIIALNTPSDGTALPPGIISYSLSPDADARATADQMIKDHKMTALVFAADNGLGHRIADAFTHEYTLLGGQILDSAYFDPSATDFSTQLRSLLQVHAPRTGVFQPTIRTDAEGIFLGATSQQSRMIVPQLDYFGADQLPRYGVGMIYNGTPNVLADQDKNGLVIPVEPILLAANAGPNDPLLGTYERASLSQLPRLFAFGSDAMLIASDLKTLLGHQPLTGLTGTLTLSLTGEIDRKPAWGRFKQGLLQPLEGTDTHNIPSTVLSDPDTPTKAAQDKAAIPAVQPGAEQQDQTGTPPAAQPPVHPDDRPSETAVPTFTDGGGLAPAPTTH
ncbi:penicillin-binding protein activator [Halothiobacillus diazotrophicus]|nr:penicillin-binding protein activator [Halothiobacillus diazotrophicus]